MQHLFIHYFRFFLCNCCPVHWQAITISSLVPWPTCCTDKSFCGVLAFPLILYKLLQLIGYQFLLGGANDLFLSEAFHGVMGSNAQRIFLEGRSPTKGYHFHFFVAVLIWSDLYHRLVFVYLCEWNSFTYCPFPSIRRSSCKANFISQVIYFVIFTFLLGLIQAPRLMYGCLECKKYST